MFKSNYPLFDLGRILKSSMLEDLRDYPREFLNIKYSKYSNGILAGCDIEVIDNFLVIKKGVIKYEGNIYMLSQDYSVKYENNNELTSLKVKFMPSQISSDYIKNETEIYLSEDTECKSDEIELCRFKLRTGAVLRNNYVSFNDFATEFDTVNIVNTEFAAYGGASLSPTILRRFGQEMLKCNLTESFDISFASLCVQEKETIEKDIILSYIASKINIGDMNYSNEDIYNYLLEILNMLNDGQDTNNNHRRNKYKKILID